VRNRRKRDIRGFGAVREKMKNPFDPEGEDADIVRVRLREKGA